MDTIDKPNLKARIRAVLLDVVDYLPTPAFNALDVLLTDLVRAVREQPATTIVLRREDIEAMVLADRGIPIELLNVGESIYINRYKAGCVRQKIHNLRKLPDPVRNTMCFETKTVTKDGVKVLRILRTA